MVKFSNIKESVIQEFNNFFIHKAYLHFFFDSEHRESTIIPIQRIPLIVSIKAYQQSFILQKPDYYLNGKPVYKLIDGYPISVQSTFQNVNDTMEIEVFDNLAVNKVVLEVKKNLELKYAKTPHLVLEVKTDKQTKKPKNAIKLSSELEYAYLKTNILEKRDVEHSSYELDSWLKTGYVSFLLRIKMLDLTVIFVWILTILLTIMGTWIVADNYLEEYYRAKFKSGSLIIEIFKILLIGVF